MSNCPQQLLKHLKAARARIQELARKVKIYGFCALQSYEQIRFLYLFNNAAFSGQVPK